MGGVRFFQGRMRYMIDNVLTRPPHLPLIAPSVLAADFARLGAEAADVAQAGADLLHVDIMDGHFVPNLTMGPDIVMALKRGPSLLLDVHLMVTHPEHFVEPFAKAGAGHLTFHIEPFGGPAHKGGDQRTVTDAIELIKGIHQLGCTAGVSLNPETPVDLLVPILKHVDLILVMSVHPGYTGQAFMPETLDKVRWLRHELQPNQRLQIDGGIGIRTAHQALEAGADVLVAGAAIFRVPERQTTIRLLRGDYPK